MSRPQTGHAPRDGSTTNITPATSVSPSSPLVPPPSLPPHTVPPQNHIQPHAFPLPSPELYQYTEAFSALIDQLDSTAFLTMDTGGSLYLDHAYGAKADEGRRASPSRNSNQNSGESGAQEPFSAVSSSTASTRLTGHFYGGQVPTNEPLMLLVNAATSQPKQPLISPQPRGPPARSAALRPSTFTPPPYYPLESNMNARPSHRSPPPALPFPLAISNLVNPSDERPPQAQPLKVTGGERPNTAPNKTPVVSMPPSLPNTDELGLQAQRHLQMYLHFSRQWQLQQEALLGLGGTPVGESSSAGAQPGPSSQNDTPQPAPNDPTLGPRENESNPTSPGGQSAADSSKDMDDYEDKRRRNTAASARFRRKKKERTNDIAGRINDLENRLISLQKQAEGLHRENGWLKEIVVLKARMNSQRLQNQVLISAAVMSSRREDDARDDAGK